MKIRAILGALVLASLPALPALAENMTPEDIKKLVDEAVEKRLKEHERHEGGMQQGQAEPGSAPQYPVATGPMTDIRVGRPGEEKIPLGFGSTGSGKLLYAKPFLSAPKATVGGYADVMYNSLSRQNLDNPSRNSFGQQRLVPFIYADITDHIKFATEIEIERGGPNAPQGTDGSIQIEFAQLDYLITEAINLRAGILLMPVGKFNLLHDSPLNDLVDRPRRAHHVEVAAHRLGVVAEVAAAGKRHCQRGGQQQWPQGAARRRHGGSVRRPGRRRSAPHSAAKRAFPNAPPAARCDPRRRAGASRPP